ncbi:hypothetical protein [Nannocystis pusilla]|uniref:hypothetical protein n=1 Tax=Nannocystis pusilla TaxID=889268 RepID=UPI003B7B4DAA
MAEIERHAILSTLDAVAARPPAPPRSSISACARSSTAFTPTGGAETTMTPEVVLGTASRGSRRFRLSPRTALVLSITAPACRRSSPSASNC